VIKIDTINWDLTVINNMIKKIFCTTFIFASMMQMCYSQILDISKFGMQTGVMNSYENNPIPKKAFIYSVNIAVNKLGKIDSVYFSKVENVDLGKVVNLNAIKSNIMANKDFFKKYKSCVIVAPVMIINLNDQFISFQNELVKEWNSLFPDVAKFKNRRTVLCKPINRSYIIDYN